MPPSEVPAPEPRDAATHDETGDTHPAASLPPAGAAPWWRRPRGIRALVIVAALAAGSAFTLSHASPVLKVSPGPAPELTRSLAGAQSNPQLAHGGELRFTTIAVDRLTWLGVLRCKVTGCQTQLSPPSATVNDAAALAAAKQDMQKAQEDAAVVARALAGASPAHPAAVLRVPTGDIGGPSAGLMMSLAFTDALSDGDLTGGKVVAGTGTVAADGTVGAISGIADKVEGARRVHAQVFLAPAIEAAAAQRAAPSGMQVVPVRTAADALDWLCAHGASSSACAAHPPTG